MVGNKLDLNDKRKVSEEEGRELGKFWLTSAKLFDIPFIETSAKDCINTDELFKLAMKTFLQTVNNPNRDSEQRKTLVIDIDKVDRGQEKSEKENCCLK